jgi:hypothetical protein
MARADKSEEPAGRPMSPLRTSTNQAARFQQRGKCAVHTNLMIPRAQLHGLATLSLVGYASAQTAAGCFAAALLFTDLMTAWACSTRRDTTGAIAISCSST